MTDDDLVTCDDCGRTGVEERIERLPCPHVGLEHRITTYQGP